MSTKYTMEVSFTPLCTSCGKELEIGLTESRPSKGPFDRDNPYDRKDRRVFVNACPDCFVFKGDITNLPALSINRFHARTAN